ncbi:hypothetical protein ATY75_13170 [Rhizobium sp. N122]|nr:hypothetical protein ATY75_13170 [Rhizobium sp. N122]
MPSSAEAALGIVVPASMRIASHRCYASPARWRARPASGSFADILVVGFDVSAEKRAARDFLTRYAGLHRFI